MSKNTIAIFKCLADKSRLRILNYLIERPMYVELISELLDLNPSTISFHLKKLEDAGLVYSTKEQYYVTYHINPDILQHKLSELVSLEYTDSNEQKEREDNYRRKVLEAFFEYGKLKSLPVQQKKRRIVLEEIARSFEKDKTYPEREVNIIIADFNDNFCTIRRDMVDEKILERENGIYRLT
ncbi:metalloregulator ArsR/SmtB family transcription factor [Alkalicella caledoniensis]|uniref:Metalloregulator ArsR/SmtB family transcription factor n=1 Tax=Alkalicella caledoniensis TaxID=2731377 RepID=A0A7G9W8R8_ALKCA|nr:metalloregulator ArsR/SmtB family transcription factor [Alkalicella caledoniensis]QNO15080.1 metalloregulator ArsR/SmtB family transcription factor [Alkalicella caledoniensis]